MSSVPPPPLPVLHSALGRRLATPADPSRPAVNRAEPGRTSLASTGLLGRLRAVGRILTDAALRLRFLHRGSPDRAKLIITSEAGRCRGSRSVSGGWAHPDRLALLLLRPGPPGVARERSGRAFGGWRGGTFGEPTPAVRVTDPYPALAGVGVRQLLTVEQAEVVVEAGPPIVARHGRGRRPGLRRSGSRSRGTSVYVSFAAGLTCSAATHPVHSTSSI